MASISIVVRVYERLCLKYGYQVTEKEREYPIMQVETPRAGYCRQECSASGSKWPDTPRMLFIALHSFLN